MTRIYRRIFTGSVIFTANLITFIVFIAKAKNTPLATYFVSDFVNLVYEILVAVFAPYSLATDFITEVAAVPQPSCGISESSTLALPSTNLKSYTQAPTCDAALL